MNESSLNRIRTSASLSLLGLAVIAACFVAVMMGLTAYVSNKLGTNYNDGSNFWALLVFLAGVIALVPLRSVYWEFSWLWAGFLGSLGTFSIFTGFVFGVTDLPAEIGATSTENASEYSVYFVVMASFGALLLALFALLIVEQSRSSIVETAK